MGLEQPAKAGLSKGGKVGLGVAAAVFGLVVIGSLGDSDKASETRSSRSDASTAAESTSDAAPLTDRDTPAAAGSTVRDGKFEFRVLGVERGQQRIEDAFAPEIAKGEFFIVKLRVTNIGDDARSFSATNQKLLINGNKYEATSILGDNSWMEDINPGLGIETQAVFDIPPGSVPTAIECHDSMFSGGALLAL
ncbi:DUF4352 domain-containing protein [Mycolicibacterium sp. 22603]|uniref:DUF4352 domain-containing protein n=1 Tax=Mycolicibacterium sp. 22603 TaxID=3453950 RepID=UPI003F851D66